MKPIKAIVCDFDGTYSTLRCGWESVMKRMMLKYLPGEDKWIDAFIGEKLYGFGTASKIGHFQAIFRFGMNVCTCLDKRFGRIQTILLNGMM